MERKKETVTLTITTSEGETLNLFRIGEGTEFIGIIDDTWPTSPFLFAVEEELSILPASHTL